MSTHSFSHSGPDARRAPSALQAACLTAGLASAFALGAPAHAQAPQHLYATDSVSGQQTEIQDGSYVTVNGSGAQTGSLGPYTFYGPDDITVSPISESATATTLNGQGIVVLSNSVAPVGQDFSTAFANTSVVGYDATDPAAYEEGVLGHLGDEQGADYQAFTTSLYVDGGNGPYTISTSATSAYAIVFPVGGVGTLIGSVSLPLADQPSEQTDPDIGPFQSFQAFGVAPAPEPAAALPLLLGGLGVAGLGWKARRKASPVGA